MALPEPLHRRKQDIIEARDTLVMYIRRLDDYLHGCLTGSKAERERIMYERHTVGAFIDLLNYRMELEVTKKNKLNEKIYTRRV